MNHFLYSIQGMGKKPEVYSELQANSYENLKDQEKLLLQEKEVRSPSVVWKSHRRQGKAEKVRRTFLPFSGAKK
ncbi:MAG: hypothetical protein WDA09_06885 [Bacteriovoracaceae bacterium]